MNRTAKERARAAFAVFGKHAPFLLTLMFVGMLPIILLTLAAAYFRDDTATGISLLDTASTVLSLLAGPLMTGALLHALGRIAAHGEVDIPEAYAASLRAYDRMLIAHLLTGLVVFLGFIAFILPGIFLAVRLSLVSFCAYFERTMGIESLKRSWEHTRLPALEILGIILLFGLFQAALIIPMAPLAALNPTPAAEMLLTFMGQLLGLVFAVILQTWLYEVYRDVMAAPVRDEILFRPLDLGKPKDD